MTVCDPDLKEERRLRREGHEWVAGLDEVGRGAWAGPSPSASPWYGPGSGSARCRLAARLKMLTEDRREESSAAVGKSCEAWAIGHTTARECDGGG